MICIYCGAKIDPEKPSCPCCGKRGNRREGGEGFWDIARGPVQEESHSAVSPNTWISKPRLLLAICGVVLFLSVVIAIIGTVGSYIRIRAIRKEYETQLAQLAGQLPQERDYPWQQDNQKENDILIFSGDSPAEEPKSPVTDGEQAEDETEADKNPDNGRTKGDFGRHG